MWVDRVAVVGPGSARPHTAAFVIGGCVALPSAAGPALRVRPFELEVFTGIGEEGVEVDSAMTSPHRESRT